MRSLFELYREHQGKVSIKWSIYLSEYDRLFSSYRARPVRMLEIGIQNGGSLEIWSKYFQNARILAGCDINPDCAELTYDDPRIKVIVGDANTTETEAEILSHSSQFDLIIDDGSHTSSDIVKTFARYFRHLSQGGVFVTEDLHCSYWKNFQGGLYYPYSSMAFFKQLADIINHEHWGIDKQRKQHLQGFSEQFLTDFDEFDLAEIHSIEFFNSVCVIHKRNAQSNVLGALFIAGQNELIVSGHHGLCGGLSNAQRQSDNPWSVKNCASDEYWERLTKAVVERNGQIASLSQTVVERDGQIASLSQGVAERDGQIASLSQGVAERDGQIANLHQAVAGRDGQIASLNQVMSERDGQIASPNQAVAERDGQIASLNQTVVERDGQIASLSQTVVERDGQIASLSQTVVERDGQITAQHNSVSWRLTRPLRAIKRLLKGAL